MDIFSMQVRAAGLILLVVLIRSLLLYKLPKKIFLWLWGLVVLRLLIPYSPNISLGFSLPGIEQLWYFLPHKAGGFSSGAIANIEVLPNTLPWELRCLWLSGCGILLAYFIGSHVRGRKLYRFAVPAGSEAVLSWKASRRLRRRVKILQCPNLSNALTYGILRPVILLPSATDFRNTAQLDAVLSHEWEHIRHFDVLWKWISAIVLCLNWYNPFVWVLYILLGRDLELHCDECVLKRLGFTKKNKTAYAMELLALAETKQKPLPLASHFSRSATEERVLCIMYGHSAPARDIGIALLGIALLALLSFATFYMEAGIAFTMPLK